MTLVAKFSLDGRPVLLGDLMLSCVDDGRDYKPFSTPLHLDPNREVRRRSPYMVAGLTQKVIVLSPRLAVAWSGLMSQAEYPIKNLGEHFANVGCSVTELVEFLDSHCASCDELYLTGLMALDASEGNLPVASFAWPHGKGEQISSARFGDCFIGGSGATEFADVLRFAEGLNFKTDRTTNACEHTVAGALSIVALLSGEQTRAGNGLAKLYGGGFEVATVLGRDIVKIGEIGYHLCEARIAKNGQVTVTFHSIVKIAYDDDRLMIRRLVPFRIPATPVDECFIISPVHRQLSEEGKTRVLKQATLPAFESRFCVFYLHVPQAPPRGRIRHLVHYRAGEGEAAVLVRECADHLELRLSSELVRRIGNTVQQAVAGDQGA